LFPIAQLLFIVTTATSLLLAPRWRMPRNLAFRTMVTTVCGGGLMLATALARELFGNDHRGDTFLALVVLLSGGGALALLIGSWFPRFPVAERLRLWGWLSLALVSLVPATTSLGAPFVGAVAAAALPSNREKADA
jgi:MFS family permease